MSQFLEVIEWFDETGEEIVHRIPETGSGEVKLGAQLIVRESQAAVFFRDGKGLDVFGAGRHTLTTLNIPILTKVLALPWGFTSPFRAETCFVNLKRFTNLRWGTKDPVAFKDRELGLVRLRAFGAFTMQVTQPLLFINTLVGTRGTFATADIEDFLREVIVSRLNDYLGETVDTLVELPKHYDEMAGAVRTRLTDDFRRYGVELTDFYISRITPPEDVQRMIDERSGMAAVGNLDEFFKYKAAKAMGDAATGGGAGGGDVAGAAAAGGMGVGVGAGLGMMLPGMLLGTLNGQTGGGAGPKGGAVGPSASGGPSGGAAPDGARCPECHGAVGLDSRFCAHCGHQLVVIKKCPRCDKNVTTQAKFCSACGLDFSIEHRCTSCDVTLPAGTRYCMRCGERVATEEPRA